MILLCSEVLNTIERILLLVLTGMPKFYHRTHFRWSGLDDSIRNLYWPSFSENKVNLALEPMQINTRTWPKDHFGHFVLLQEAAVIFNYGPTVWAKQRHILEAAIRGNRAVDTQEGMMDALEIELKAMVREQADWVRGTLDGEARKNYLRKVREGADGAHTTQYIRRCDDVSLAFSTATKPFNSV